MYDEDEHEGIEEEPHSLVFPNFRQGRDAVGVEHGQPEEEERCECGVWLPSATGKLRDQHGEVGGSEEVGREDPEADPVR